MSSFNPAKFTDPDWLHTMSPARLIRMLSPWRLYLAESGFDLPPENSASVDLTALARVLMVTNSRTPSAMFDALYYIHETASPEDIEALHQKIGNRKIDIRADPTASAADYVIDVWLAYPELVEERHAEKVAFRQKTFHYYAGRGGEARAFPVIDAETQKQIEASFDAWFDDHRRGRGSRLFIIRQTPIVWVLVRHGDLIRREASHGEDGTATSALYRPQRHDVLFYNEADDQIGVHAGTEGERNLYLGTLGRLGFSDAGYFPTAQKYTLAPLSKVGAEALNCADVADMRDVKLTEYRRYLGGKFKRSITDRATDIFADLRERGRDKLDSIPVSATFQVRFDASSKPRRVVIRPPAIASYQRNEDSALVEQWLGFRGFLLDRPAD